MKMILAFLVITLPLLSNAAHYFNDPSLTPEMNMKVDNYLTERCQNYHDTQAVIKSARLTKTLVEEDTNRPNVTFYTLDLAVTFDDGSGPFELYQMIQFDNETGPFEIVSTFGACKAHLPGE